MMDSIRRGGGSPFAVELFDADGGGSWSSYTGQPGDIWLIGKNGVLEITREHDVLTFPAWAWFGLRYETKP